MPKAYRISVYREIKDPAKVAAYAKLGGPALAAHGAKFLARGVPVAAYEAGLKERAVVIEFESAAKAIAAHDSAAYKEALAALGDGAVRDLRIVEGDA
jgi:uncharacterized protein (DUF1330 family)